MACVSASLAAALALSGSVPARASSTQVSVFEDNNLLLSRGDATRDNTLDTLAAMGVDTVHVLVIWNRFAPQPLSFTRPNFDATDPGGYVNWQPLDALVAGATARGMHVLLSPTGRAPAWASECKGSVSERQRCLPRASEYGAFVKALATRYPASAVSRWSFWNEPNHSSWLRPQHGRRLGVQIDVAAMRYRQLVTAGIAALDQTGHGDDTILLGETAPLGSSKSTPPVDFDRELFCLDRNYRPFRGVAARARDCTTRRRLAVTGVSHHPYTLAGVARPSFTGHAGDVPIGALGRIIRVVDAAARFGILAHGLPLYLTEFGFQTRPPDPFGMSLGDQARYLNESDYIAYRNRRVASVAQYALRDDRARAGFNTGLLFANGGVKPALAAYRMPIWIVRGAHGSGKVFGQLRAARQSVTVAIQHRGNAGQRFATVAEVQTNARGYFLRSFARIAGQWRLQHDVLVSRVATAGA